MSRHNEDKRRLFDARGALEMVLAREITVAIFDAEEPPLRLTLKQSDAAVEAVFGVLVGLGMSR